VFDGAVSTAPSHSLQRHRPNGRTVEHAQLTQTGTLSSQEADSDVGDVGTAAKTARTQKNQTTHLFTTGRLKIFVRRIRLHTTAYRYN